MASTPTPSVVPPTSPSPPVPTTTSPPPSSTPPPSTTPPPTPASLPPSSPPPVPTSPPPQPSSPPPVSPPPIVTVPPPSSPPPVTPSPPPPTISPPPPSVVPPTLPSSPPPPSVVPPPKNAPPPQPPPSPPLAPPTPDAPPPPVGRPPPQPPKSTPSPPPNKPPAKSPPPPPAESPPPGSPPSPPGNPSAPLPPTSPPIKASPPSPANSSNPVPTGPQTPRPPSSPQPTTIPTPSSDNSNLPNNDNNNSGGIKAGAAAGIGVAVILVVLSLGIIVCFLRRRRKRNGGGYVVGGYAGGHVMPSSMGSSQISESPYPRSPTAPLVKNSSSNHGFPYSPPEPGLGNSKSWFTYEELSEITNGFSQQNILGEGGFGFVYKGCLPDGREVAVKQLKVGGGQGEREFQAEVEIISRVHHRHLVSLVGYCISEHQRLLVYDFVPNNTLHYHLHGDGRPVMDWATRVKVAAGAARGLAYLHEDCHPRIIHRDIKSSNILLDNSFEAQVSDFGLAKLTVDAQTHVTTRVMGTFGYLAPEYASSGKLTDRSDVFSFGVVLLELITGRKPVDASQPVGDESLVEWARPLMSRALETGLFDDLPDPRLEKNYNASEMFRMIETAAACVRHSAPMRPRMGLVMRALDNFADDLDLHNGVRPGQSELFNSGANSAEIRIFQRMAFGTGSQQYSSDFGHASWSSHRDL